MDASTIFALVYSLIILVVVGVLLFLSKPPSAAPPSASFDGRKYAAIVGQAAPYTLLGAGPIVDIYYRKFKYSIITVIGVGSMLLAYAFQTLVRGGNQFLPSTTVGFAAAATYLLYDIWMNDDGTQYPLSATLLAAVLSVLHVLYLSPGGYVFANPLINGVLALVMGIGFGVLGWTIVYNTDASRLPH
jgi:hypothetical protein